MKPANNQIDNEQNNSEEITQETMVQSQSVQQSMGSQPEQAADASPQETLVTLRAQVTQLREETLVTLRAQVTQLREENARLELEKLPSKLKQQVDKLTKENERLRKNNAEYRKYSEALTLEMKKMGVMEKLLFCTFFLSAVSHAATAVIGLNMTEEDMMTYVRKNYGIALAAIGFANTALTVLTSIIMIHIYYPRFQRQENQQVGGQNNAMEDGEEFYECVTSVPAAEPNRAPNLVEPRENLQEIQVSAQSSAVDQCTTPQTTTVVVHVNPGYEESEVEDNFEAMPQSLITDVDNNKGANITGEVIQITQL